MTKNSQETFFKNLNSTSTCWKSSSFHKHYNPSPFWSSQQTLVFNTNCDNFSLDGIKMNSTQNKHQLEKQTHQSIFATLKSYPSVIHESTVNYQRAFKTKESPHTIQSSFEYMCKQTGIVDLEQCHPYQLEGRYFNQMHKMATFHVKISKLYENKEFTIFEIHNGIGSRDAFNEYLMILIEEFKKMNMILKTNIITGGNDVLHKLSFTDLNDIKYQPASLIDYLQDLFNTCEKGTAEEIMDCAPLFVCESQKISEFICAVQHIYDVWNRMLTIISQSFNVLLVRSMIIAMGNMIRCDYQYQIQAINLKVDDKLSAVRQKWSTNQILFKNLNFSILKSNEIVKQCDQVITMLNTES